jgi:hypothetical protein
MKLFVLFFLPALLRYISPCHYHISFYLYSTPTNISPVPFLSTHNHCLQEFVKVITSVSETH